MFVCLFRIVLCVCVWVCVCVCVVKLVTFGGGRSYCVMWSDVSALFWN
jgi:hypothetical protein